MKKWWFSKIAHFSHFFHRGYGLFSCSNYDFFWKKMENFGYFEYKKRQIWFSRTKIQFLASKRALQSRYTVAKPFFLNAKIFSIFFKKHFYWKSFLFINFGPKKKNGIFFSPKSYFSRPKMCFPEESIFLFSPFFVFFFSKNFKKIDFFF